MRREDAYALAGALAAAFPWIFREPEVGDLWAGQLQDLPLDAAREAVQRVIRHHDRPTIKLVREVARNLHAYGRRPALPAYTDRPVSPDEIRAGVERYRRAVAERRAGGGAEGGTPDPTTRRRPPPEDCPDCGETMAEGRLRHAELCLPRSRAEAVALEGG